ncbi:MAG: YheT family hydrolase [Myxococcota bacterium]
MILDKENFKSPFWLKGPHSQTIYTNRIRRAPKVRYHPERVELPDGDFVDVFWSGQDCQSWVICLPGIFGSKNALYVRGAVSRLNSMGLGVVVIHYRGAHGVLNRLPQAYHLGAIDVPLHLLSLIQSRYPGKGVGVIGFSLGGCLALQMLLNDADDIKAAAVISAPTDPLSCARQVERPEAWMYRRNFMKRLHNSLSMKEAQLRPLGIDIEGGYLAQNIFDFDERVTAPLHGYSGAEDYYAQCRTVHRLIEIKQPTCFISSFDDPVLGSDCFPSPETVSDSVELHLTHTGGHVGFVKGVPWKADYWAERIAVDFLVKHLKN